MKKDFTEQAKLVWNIIMPGHPWPKGWEVKFKAIKGSYGWCNWGKKRITLSSHHMMNGHEIIVTLIHELVHMHYQRNLKHGIEFRKVQGRWMERFYGEPKLVPWKGKLYDPKTGRLSSKCS